MSEQQSANVYDFLAIKESRIPKGARGFCDGLSLLQAIIKLTNRISELYDNSIELGQEIDEDEATVTEHIIGLMRDTYHISTDEIQNHIQSTFNLRDDIILIGDIKTQAS